MGVNARLLVVAFVAALCIAYTARAQTAESITTWDCRFVDSEVHPNGVRYDMWTCGARPPFVYVLLPNSPRRGRDLAPMGPPLKQKETPGIEL